MTLRALPAMTRLFRFLNGMLPEEMHINTLLRRMESKLFDGGRHGEGEMVGRIAVRLSHARDLDIALRRLYGVIGWDTVAMKLMWYVEQIAAGCRRGDAE